MKQYSFEITNRRTGGARIDHARATALNADIARAQIVLTYGSQFDIAALYSDINPAHHIAGEIDCSAFPLADMQWLLSEATKIEGGAV